MCFVLNEHNWKKTVNSRNTDNKSEQLNLEMELIAYAHAELDFLQADVSIINSKIENDSSFFLYTGRATCQWCRKIVPILSRIIKENNISIYYLDSENSDTNSELSAFREKYEIETVPSIIYFEGSEEYYSFELDALETDLYDIERKLKSEFERAYALESNSD